MRNALLVASSFAIVAASAASAMETSDINLDLDAALERGQELYDEVGICSACHGMEGEGGIGPALNIDAAMPTDVMYQLQTNPQMVGIDDMLDPITEQDMFAMSVYIRKLANLDNDAETLEQIAQSAEAALRSTETQTTFFMSERDKKVEEIQSFQNVVETWERRAKEGSLKRHYDVQVLATFDEAEPLFTPEPGKTYWYQQTGITPFSLGGAEEALGGAESSQIVVGDQDTKEIIATYMLPRDMRGEVHTTVATPDGRYTFMTGNRPEGGASDSISIQTPATLLKMDALSLQPVANLDIGGRIHHGQLFQDKYILIDTFARDEDGLDVFLFDPETDEIVGGIQAEDLGGKSYTSFTDNEYIYVLMQPLGYGVSALSGARAAMMFHKGDMVTMRPFWVSKIDPETWEVVAEYPYPGYRANWITIDSASEYMYIMAGAGSIVTKMNVKTGEHIWSEASGIGPYGAALTADESELWVADKGETAGMFGRTVTVFNAETGRHQETLFSGYKVDHILLSPDGKEMWGTSNGEGKVYVWDAETREQIHIIDMPGRGDPHGTVWVHYDENGEGRVVRDQGNFHNGIHPAKGNPLK